MERRKRIIEIVNDPNNNNYLQYLSNPLLLSMFIISFENHPEIPKRKSAFYRNVFDTLYSRHDGITKNSFPREKLTGLERDNFEKVLSIFSYITLAEGRYSFTEEFLSDKLLRVRKSTDCHYEIGNLIYDLRTSISILILDGFEYSFPHRSMQEYFAALFISNLSSEKKDIAYTNLSTALQRSSTDNSINFWSLCFELDEKVFISNFLIPNLSNILLKLDRDQNDNELLSDFLSVVYPNISIGISRDTLNGVTEHITVARSVSFEYSILNYCDLINSIEFRSLFIGAKDNFKDRIEMIKSENTKMQKHNVLDSIRFDKNDRLLELLLDNNVIESISGLKDGIKVKIRKWQEQIQRSENNIDDILGI